MEARPQRSDEHLRTVGASGAGDSRYAAPEAHLLETKKIVDELEEFGQADSKSCASSLERREILGSDCARRIDIAERYGDERRTNIEYSEIEAIDIEDLIQREDMVFSSVTGAISKRFRTARTDRRAAAARSELIQ